MSLNSIPLPVQMMEPCNNNKRNCPFFFRHFLATFAPEKKHLSPGWPGCWAAPGGTARVAGILVGGSKEPGSLSGVEGEEVEVTVDWWRRRRKWPRRGRRTHQDPSSDDLEKKFFNKVLSGCLFDILGFFFYNLVHYDFFLNANAGETYEWNKRSWTNACSCWGGFKRGRRESDITDNRDTSSRDKLRRRKRKKRRRRRISGGSRDRLSVNRRHPHPKPNDDSPWAFGHLWQIILLLLVHCWVALRRLIDNGGWNSPRKTRCWTYKKMELIDTNC